MNINLLKTFLEVARQRHFGRAADKVFLTQSAVSARIKQLEESLGTDLFTRKRNKIELTPAGRRLAVSATQLVNAWEKTVNEINLVSDDDQKLIRLGINFDLWSIHLRKWLITIRQQHPELFFQVMALSSPLLTKGLLADELDAVIVFEPFYNSGLETSEIGSLDLILVSDQQITLDQAHLKDYFYVDWGTHFSSQHQQLLSDKLTPSLSFNFSSMARDHLLDQGGLCYLSQIEAQDFIDAGMLYKVIDAPEFQRKIYYCFRKSNTNAPILQSLVETG